MKLAKDTKLALIILLIGLSIPVIIIGAIGYVILHFILKFW